MIQTTHNIYDFNSQLEAEILSALITFEEATYQDILRVISQSEEACSIIKIHSILLDEKALASEFQDSSTPVPSQSMIANYLIILKELRLVNSFQHKNQDGIIDTYWILSNSGTLLALGS
jgi:uncharacterized protein YehS (DUF1456 family)